jgi:hypothetical protein
MPGASEPTRMPGGVTSSCRLCTYAWMVEVYQGSLIAMLPKVIRR